jgi:hypothetical protein
MPNLTWLELKEFIENNIEDKTGEVFVYDMENDTKVNCDLVEVVQDDIWQAVLGVNLEQLDVE